MRILGLDIAPQNRFAYTIVEDGKLIDQGYAEAPALLKVIKDHKPGVIALDSLSELVEYGKIIIKALGRLPFNIDVIEVTREANASVPTEVLVRRNFGINRDKLDPLETSYYLALLAEKGVGARIKLFEEETIILIKRRTSTAPGGMSRNRYMRNIKHRIRELAEKISRRLDEAGFDYDLFFKEESGDVSSAKFVVYARRDLVRRFVKPMRASDVVVTVYSEPAKRYGQERSDLHVIVGIDPGIVTGLAIVDLNGRVLHTEAKRNLSRGEALRRIYQWGIPVVVATDVTPPPEYVKKLAAMCGAVVYAPDRDLAVSEKSAIVEKINYPTSTTHERDALAAAYKAFYEYKDKFNKLEKDFKVILNDKLLEKAKILIIKGKPIAQAVAEVLKMSYDTERTKIVYVPIERPCRDQDENLRRRIAALEYEKAQLEKELYELRERLSSLSRALTDSLWRDFKYRELQRRIEDLTKSINECEEEKNRIMENIIEIIQGLLSGRYKMYDENDIVECRKTGAGAICRDLANLEDAVRSGIMGVPVNLVLRYKIGTYYIIDELKRKELLEKIKEQYYNKEIDLKKIIEEYRRRLPDLK